MTLSRISRMRVSSALSLSPAIEDQTVDPSLLSGRASQSGAIFAGRDCTRQEPVDRLYHFLVEQYYCDSTALVSLKGAEMTLPTPFKTRAPAPASAPDWLALAFCSCG